MSLQSIAFFMCRYLAPARIANYIVTDGLPVCESRLNYKEALHIIGGIS